MTNERTGFLCPSCGANTAVFNSRTTDGTYVYRRRRCLVCKTRMTTYEVLCDTPEEASITVDSRLRKNLTKRLLTFISQAEGILDLLQEGR